ncbi:MAG: hypothetical protein NZ866_02385 [Patescibacteria group bacterium]|nr:hypothetical protein [Patescibacteria group bacterium]
MIKKNIENLSEWGAIFFISLIFIGLLLYFFGYFNKLQFFWIVIFIILGWLIYIYRYYEEVHLNKDNKRQEESKN